MGMEHRQMTVGYSGLDSDAEMELGDLVAAWLSEHGAKHTWLGIGPDEHPEDWEEAV